MESNTPGAKVFQNQESINFSPLKKLGRAQTWAEKKTWVKNGRKKNPPIFFSKKNGQ